MFLNDRLVMSSKLSRYFPSRPFYVVRSLMSVLLGLSYEENPAERHIRVSEFLQNSKVRLV